MTLVVVLFGTAVVLLQYHMESLSRSPKLSILNPQHKESNEAPGRKKKQSKITSTVVTEASRNTPRRKIKHVTEAQPISRRNQIQQAREQATKMQKQEPAPKEVQKRPKETIASTSAL